MWAADAVYMIPNVPVMTGTAQIRTAAEAFFAQLTAAGSPTTVTFNLQYKVEASAVSDPHLVAAYGEQSVQIGSAPPMISYGNAVLRKEAGQWKYVVCDGGSTTFLYEK